MLAYLISNQSNHLISKPIQNQLTNMKIQLDTAVRKKNIQEKNR